MNNEWTKYRNAAWDGTLLTVATFDGTIGQIILNNITEDENVYLHIFDLAVNRAISVSDYSATVAGTVLAKCSVPHGLGDAGDTATVTVEGTTNYNGAVSVTVVDGLKFYYTETYVAVETGTFKTLITPGTTVSDITLKVGGGNDGLLNQLVYNFPEPGFKFIKDLQILATTTIDGSTGAPSAVLSLSMLMR